MFEEFKPLASKLTSFCQKRLKFDKPPKLFLKSDEENSQNALGKTAHYDPSRKEITIFVSGRHIKDVLRSLSHELVHHSQNLRGDLTPKKCGNLSDNYAQENEHMRNMEKEAYLVGNMNFRDWEDEYKFSIKESIILKENKRMTRKISKENLVQLIREAVAKKMAAKFTNEPDPGEDSVEEAHEPDHEEEIEEAKGDKGDADPLAGARSKFDKDLDGVPDGGDEDPDDPEVNESNDTLNERRQHLGTSDQGKITHHQSEGLLAGGKPVKCLADLTGVRLEKGIDPSNFQAAGCAEFKSDPAPGGREKNPGMHKMAMLDMLEENKDINTPEKEQILYESRFSKRNEDLFNKLSKLWTK